MESVVEVLSVFKDKLNVIINDLNESLSNIEKEEEFIQVLGDLVNYCKSDYMLLPFYDETILSRVFERVFPLPESFMKKIKTAAYLIEASKSIDKSNFLQYNNSVDDIKSINEKLSSYYDDLLSNDTLKSDKENVSNKISLYSSFYDIIGDDCFTALISDVDLFKEIVDLCKLDDNSVNILLNVAIKCNLGFLDSTGIVVEEDDSSITNMKNDNRKMQEEIKNLSNLLGNE